MGDNYIEIEKNPELETVLLKNPDVIPQVGALRETADQLDEILMMYDCAIREVRTKLEVLNEEFKVRKSHNPIEYIKSRVKKPASIHEKLIRRNLPVTLESIQENLHDVAGIRVICSYVQDIYKVMEIITEQDDITLLEVKDYIAKPKPNGYRSLHLVLAVPVFFSDCKKTVKVEVQIRTIAMDFWATLEHQLKYKSTGPVPEEVIGELKACSDVISQTDFRMQNIYNTLNI